jgi:hypothetical protein
MSVYVDWAASSDDLRYRTTVDLIGSFDEDDDGRLVARRYAAQLSAALGLPAAALPDLILATRTTTGDEDRLGSTG